MRLLRFFIVLMIATLFCAEACALTASYEQTIKGAGLLAGKQTQFIKIKDDKVRIEMDTPDGKAITIIKEGAMYSYIPSENKAIKIINQGSFNTGVLSDYGTYLKSLNAKVVGSERIEDYDCDIYEFKDPRTKVSSKVWLWRQEGFPVKVENKASNGTVTTIMKNVRVGIDLDDSEFMLPAGVEIVIPGEIAY